METLNKKTLKVSRGFTYTYYTSPAQGSKPTLLLQHGFPDEAAEWADLITAHLVPAGYGVVAPDMLGYAGTSKPTDPAAFKITLLTKDLCEILDAEKIAQVISFGHDWGSSMAQSFASTAPERVVGLGMINVGYMPPSDQKFNLDMIIAGTTEAFGYGTFWYWKFFTEQDDAAQLMKQHADRAFDLLHAPWPIWVATMCQKDGVRNAITDPGYDFQTQSYATEAMKKHFVQRFQRDGFESPLCWYKATVFGHQDEERGAGVGAKVKVPSLFVTYKEDMVCRKEMYIQPTLDGTLEDVTVVEHDGAHWGLLEKPEEFGRDVVGWLEKKF